MQHESRDDLVPLSGAAALLRRGMGAADCAHWCQGVGRAVRGIFLSAAELDGLHGCGPLAGLAYIWLRTFVDLRSGVVGRLRPVSLAMLRAYCETHTPKGGGVQIVQPSERNVRTALSSLERAGMLRRLEDDRRLVFRLPLMKTLALDQIEPDANPRGEPDRESGAVDKGRITLQDAGVTLPRAQNPAANPPEAKSVHPTHIGDQRGKPSHPHTAAAYPGGLRAREPVAAAGGDARRQAVADLLRGAGVRVAGADPALADLVARDVGDADLLTAVELARQARAAEGSSQPIGVRYVLALLDRLQFRQKRVTAAWWSTEEGALTKGAELGLAPRAGESWAEYRGRVRAAIAAAA
ncbi:hypothetical protein MASR2M16_15030 [Thauera terpenica]